MALAPRERSFNRNNRTKMNKQIVTILLLLTPVLSGICQVDNKDQDSIPSVLKPYISSMSISSDFKELPNYVVSIPPKYITKKQALEDIEMVQYLFDNAYCGRDYWGNNGINFNQLSAELSNYVNSCSSDLIDVKRFEDLLYNFLSPINDGHTSIKGFNDRTLIKWLIPYFAEIVIEEKDGKFIVVESNQTNIKRGFEYQDSQKFLFKTISKRNTEQYLIGQLSIEKIDTLNVRFNVGMVALNLHSSRIENVKVDHNDKVVQIDTINKIPVIRSSSFIWSKKKEQDFKLFVEYGKKIESEPIFIWNLIYNWGGSEYFPYSFVKNFNSTSNPNAYVLVQHSPPSNQCYWCNKNSWLEMWDEASMKALNDDNYPIDSVPSNRQNKIRKIRIEKQSVKTSPSKYWEIKTRPENQMGVYKGTAIILMSNRTASAGNNAVAISKTIPQNILIGSNTSSSYAIGNVKNYCLKNSLIRFGLPGTLTIHPDNKLEKGFLPDYWLDSEKPVKEVIDWIKNPDTYQFKYLTE